MDSRKHAPTASSAFRPVRLSSPTTGAREPTPGSYTTANGDNKKQASVINIALPSSGNGGGAHRAIDGQFKVNAANGTMSLNLPIYTSPCRAGFSPEICLSYDSGQGNGPFGVGWSLTNRHISRKTTQRIPKYDESDVFVHSSIDDLVPAIRSSSNGSVIFEEFNVDDHLVRRYRPRVETESMRIERWTSRTDYQDVHWRTISSDNVTTIYGLTAESQIYEISNGFKRISSWLCCSSYDAWGNAIAYTYKKDSVFRQPDKDFHGLRSETAGQHATQTYLKSIKYSNRAPNRDLITWQASEQGYEWLFEVIMDYGEHDVLFPTTEETNVWKSRKDPFSSYRTGFQIRTNRLCRRILMFHHFPTKLQRADTLASSTSLDYAEDDRGSFLSSFTASGHAVGPDGNLTTEALPPYRFEYSHLPVGNFLNDAPICSLTTDNLPLTRSMNAQWIDLDGEGCSGLLSTWDEGASMFHRNQSPLLDIADGPLFASAQYLPTQPSMCLNKSPCFLDLDGNGRLDLICLDRQGQRCGFYERLDGEDWSDFSPFPSTLSGRTTDADLSVIDLTGDGLGDVMLIDEDTDSVVWHLGLGKSGFAPEQRKSRTNRGPWFSRRDQTISVHCADMSGDGLADIVHIHNDHISYWPNLGYGSFGCEIAMDNSPHLDHQNSFTSERVRLVDVSGSGTTDLLYLPYGGGAQLYFNLAGNGWSQRVEIPNFPALDKLSTVFVADLFANGTACLCWSLEKAAGENVALQYLHLTAGKKPNLLEYYSNGLGEQTHVKYRPSTSYYLEDERHGQPWTNKVPFPIHCVSQVRTMDIFAETSKTTKYKYHDGYFDRLERDFCGFASVEQWESENLCTGTQVDHKTPTIYTKTWYSNGSVADGPMRQMFEPAAQVHSKVPQTSGLRGNSDGRRALRGSPLRNEIYIAHDGVSTIPHMVTSTAYEVKRTQSGCLSVGAAHKVIPRETLTMHYEGKAEEPRIVNDLVMQVNDYGDVVKSVNISYGRKAESQELLRAEAQAAQMETLVECQEHKFAEPKNNSYNFRKAVVYESHAYRVVNVRLRERLDFDSVYSMNFNDVPVVAAMPDPRISSSRPVKVEKYASRTYYRNESMTDRLALGNVDMFSVVDQQYELSLNMEHIQLLTASEATSCHASSKADLTSEGGFVDLDSDDRWWVPAARKYFSGDEEAITELDAARKSFYTPSITMDPFNSVSRVQYDEFCLLPLKTIDSAKNEAEAEYDYLRLQAVQVTDANRNRSQVALDALGRVTGVAVLGKETEEVGDSLSGFQPAVSHDISEAFVTSPTEAAARALIGNAGKRIIYAAPDALDISRGKALTTMPAHKIEISRDCHYREADVALSISFTYFDGRGRPMQQVELVEMKGQNQQWRVREWIIKDSNNNAVRTYQQFYATDPRYHFQSRANQASTIQIYDPLNRLIAILNPNGTWEKVLFAAWEQVHYDAGGVIIQDDPARDADLGVYFSLLHTSHFKESWLSTCSKGNSWQREAAQKSLSYKGTRTVKHFDARRRCLAETMTTQSKSVVTSHRYDENDNMIETRDELGRLIEFSVHDLQGRVLRRRGLDTGDKFTFCNAVGNPVLTWNSRGIAIHTLYDSLQRAIESWTRTAGHKTLTTKTVFGENEDDQRDTVRLNLRQRVSRSMDNVGLHSNLVFDFKGNCTRSSICLAKEYRCELDWSQNPRLQEVAFNESGKFDAFNRRFEFEDAHGNRTKQTFDSLGRLRALEQAHLTSQSQYRSYIRSQTYAADDRPLATEYGNGVRTECTYCPTSRLLLRQRSVRKSSAVLEDLQYTYDCLGRVTHKRDLSDQTIYYHNNVVPPDRDYTYDGFGQIISTQGRETLVANEGGGGQLIPYKAASVAKGQGIRGDGSQLCVYLETYEYDDAGNMLSITHQPKDDTSVTGWTRRFEYGEASYLEPGKVGNRLTRTRVGNIIDAYGYDISLGGFGCITSMPGFGAMSWDQNDNLRSVTTVKRKEGTPGTTWYVYNSRGHRMRKVTEQAASEGDVPVKLKETVYLNEIEIYYTFRGSDVQPDTELSTSHVAGTSIIALVEHQVFSPSSKPLIRFQLSDGVELDDEGGVASHEEYSPFGATTYIACGKHIEAPSSYRYMAYLRDRETGLFLCGKRYYAPWLCRWTSPDPIDTAGGLNLYEYVGNDPLQSVDHSGTCPEKRRHTKIKIILKKNGKRSDKDEPDLEANPAKHHAILEGIYKDRASVARPTFKNSKISKTHHDRTVKHSRSPEDDGMSWTGFFSLYYIRLTNPRFPHRVEKGGVFYPGDKGRVYYPEDKGGVYCTEAKGTEEKGGDQRGRDPN